MNVVKLESSKWCVFLKRVLTWKRVENRAGEIVQQVKCLFDSGTLRFHPEYSIWSPEPCQKLSLK